jgi:hypothetical protein
MLGRTSTSKCPSRSDRASTSPQQLVADARTFGRRNLARSCKALRASPPSSTADLTPLLTVSEKSPDRLLTQRGATPRRTYLSAVLLVGLVLNTTLGWSWADPIAGLIISAVAVKEGREAWRGEDCGCRPVGLGAEGPKPAQRADPLRLAEGARGAGSRPGAKTAAST